MDVAAVVLPPKAPQRRPKRLSLLKKVCFSAVLTVMVFGALEGILALAGVQPLNQRRDAFVGFSGNVPLFVREQSRWITNPLKLSYFNAQSFSATKSPDTIRIFCLGGSTTFGHPYDDTASFSGWLRRMLNAAAPEKTWEVVNCGGVSYASYRIALMMNELVRYEPDVFIIYSGHNEFLEQRSYGQLQQPGVLDQCGRVVSGLRISGLVDQLRGGSVLNEKSTNRLAAEVDVILDHTDGPETYHRDPVLRSGVIDHFRLSLDRIISMAVSVRAQVILVQPASNLRDFSPFKSEGKKLTFADSVRWEELRKKAETAAAQGNWNVAADLLIEASAIDPQHAGTLFRTGQMLVQANRSDEAARFLIRAKDEDVCPLRAPSEIVDAVRAAGDHHGVPVIDFPAIVTARTKSLNGHTIPGDECFLDHVHPTVAAHGDLAEALARELQKPGIATNVTDNTGVRAQAEAAILEALDPLQQALAMTRVAQVLAWSGKDQEGLVSARRAVELFPQSSEAVSQLGRMLEKTGDSKGALEQYRTAVTLNPSDSLALSRLASALFLLKDYTAAKEHWQKAIEFTPSSAPLSFRVELHVRIGDCLREQQDVSGARAEYARALQLDSTSKLALDRLSR